MHPVQKRADLKIKKSSVYKGLHGMWHVSILILFYICSLFHNIKFNLSGKSGWKLTGRLRLHNSWCRTDRCHLPGTVMAQPICGKAIRNRTLRYYLVKSFQQCYNRFVRKIIPVELLSSVQQTARHPDWLQAIPNG